MSQDDQDKINELKQALSRMTMEPAMPAAGTYHIDSQSDPRQLTLDLLSLDLSDIGTISLDTQSISALTTDQVTALNWSSLQPITGNGGGGAGIPYITSTTINDTDAWSTRTSAKITLTGDDADIEINGRSLVDSIDAIERRLALLRPNTELEKEWEELHDLAQRYRELEQHILAKTATFTALTKKN